MKTNMVIETFLAIAFALCCTLFVMCNKDNSVSPAPSTTAYNLYMTDAPADYQQVNVNITGAQVHSDVSGWVTLAIRPGIYNLLALTNGTDTLIANGQVAVGNVSQIRLMLDNSGNSVMVNGVFYPLETPSADQSGLKLNVNSTLIKGVTYNMTIDFDAGRSVVQTGANTYILKPVIRAVLTPASGQISGAILPNTHITAVLAAPTQVTVGENESEDDSDMTYSATESGDFDLQGLAAGTYNVLIMPGPPFAIQTVSNVSVAQGQVTNIGTITLH